MHNINSGYDKIKLFDHHKTAEWLNEYPWAKVNVTIDGNKLTCGTRLFWDMIWNNEIDGIVEHDDLVMQKCHKFVELVRLYDTFEWKRDTVLGGDALDLNYLMKVYDRDEFIRKMVCNILDPTQTSIITQEDRGIIRCVHMKKDKYFKMKLKNMQLIKYGDYTVSVVYAEDYVSELGNYICETHDNVDFAAMVLLDEKQVSLRSTKDNVDVSEIARKFGGGGHKHAAGYPLRYKVNKFILNNLFTN
jgi:oligoribonuclease NrnB/cAMP/cGMP phosphodiesterase (DHH superfamily)